jgi:hypothetical protein
MLEIILQVYRSQCDLLAPEQFDTEYDSPLCRAEVLHKSVADAQLYP